MHQKMSRCKIGIGLALVGVVFDRARLRIRAQLHADTFTIGGSNTEKDQAKENGSLARRILSLRYAKNKGIGLSIK